MFHEEFLKGKELGLTLTEEELPRMKKDIALYLN
jgi:hypothetical protein